MGQIFTGQNIVELTGWFKPRPMRARPMKVDTTWNGLALPGKRWYEDSGNAWSDVLRLRESSLLLVERLASDPKYCVLAVRSCVTTIKGQLCFS